MPAIRCTKKLLSQLVGKPVEVKSTTDDWHANLIRIGPKKIILFCSDATLFCCVTPPVSKVEIQSLEELFLHTLDWQMRHEGFSSFQIQHCQTNLSNMAITSSGNRSVLGSMTDYVFHLRHWIDRYGGTEHMDIRQVTHHLNEIPQAKREFHNALDSFKKSLIQGVA